MVEGQEPHELRRRPRTAAEPERRSGSPGEWSINSGHLQQRNNYELKNTEQGQLSVGWAARNSGLFHSNKVQGVLRVLSHFPRHRHCRHDRVSLLTVELRLFRFGRRLVQQELARLRRQQPKDLGLRRVGAEGEPLAVVRS